MISITQVVESFVNNSVEEKVSTSGKSVSTGTLVVGGFASLFLIGLIVFLIFLLIAKPLWNSCLVKLVPVKKCESVWHIIGTAILLSLLLPTRVSG